MRDIIIGCGMAGLGAFAADSTMEIYEKESYAGGLCSNFSINGFRFDKAVHLSFSQEPNVRKIFDKIKYNEYTPMPLSWYREKWIKHPAQNNLFPLAIEEKIEAIKSFVNRRSECETDNFRDWTIGKYGSYLYENLFKPYNEKYWCTNLENLGVQWIGNRFYTPSLDEVLFGSFTDETPLTYYAKEMRYPQQGGYISFVQAIIKQAEETKRVHYRKKVEKISLQSRTVYFENGESVFFDKAYTSMPLPELVDCIDEIPIELKAKCRNLEYTGMVLVSMGLKRIENEKLWFYIYDRDIFAARAYMPSAKAKENVPEGCSSIQFEIYFNAKDGPMDEKVCVENCYYALEKMGIARREDVKFSDCRVVDYGNVIFTKGTEEIACELTSWLKSKGIIPIGRFGEWKYYWSDQAFLSGYNAVLQSGHSD